MDINGTPLIINMVTMRLQHLYLRPLREKWIHFIRFDSHYSIHWTDSNRQNDPLQTDYRTNAVLRKYTNRYQGLSLPYLVDGLCGLDTDDSVSTTSKMFVLFNSFVCLSAGLGKTHVSKRFYFLTDWFNSCSKCTSWIWRFDVWSWCANVQVEWSTLV